jgi:hypothetical protein
MTPCRESKAVKLKLNGGNAYGRGGARLGEKYKSKYEVKGVSRSGTPQNRITLATATASLVSVQLNCPLANAEMTQK